MEGTLIKKHDRLIRLIGVISEDSFKLFSEQLAELEASGDHAVIVELCSGGGSSYDALAFAGRIRNSPCDIVIRAYGLVASAAVLVLAAGDVRYMASEAWCMVHEDSNKLRGQVYELEREASHMRRMEEQWDVLLAELTNTSTAIWAQLHRKTTYLTATECLAFGLVDKII